MSVKVVQVDDLAEFWNWSTGLHQYAWTGSEWWRGRVRADIRNNGHANISNNKLSDSISIVAGNVRKLDVMLYTLYVAKRKISYHYF